MSDTDVEIRLFQPEDSHWVVRRHGELYRESEGFDETFEPLVDSILANFCKAHDPERECGWIAYFDDRRVGSIFCVDQGENTAKLRLFSLEPEVRGQGLGFRLLQVCVNFARDAGYERMTLWTHESHKAACALYAKTGFELLSSKPVHSFGQNLIEQSWTRELKTPL